MNKKFNERMQQRLIEQAKQDYNAIMADDYEETRYEIFDNITHLLLPNELDQLHALIAAKDWHAYEQLLLAILMRTALASNDDDTFLVYGYWFYADLRLAKYRANAAGSYWQNKV